MKESKLLRSVWDKAEEEEPTQEEPEELLPTDPEEAQGEEKDPPASGEDEKTRRVLFSVAFSALALSFVILFLALYTGRVYFKAEIEAGDYVLTPEDFAKGGAAVSFDPSFSAESVSCREPGTYPVKLRSGFFSYTVRLVVRDTVPPEAKTRDLFISRGEARDPGAFIDEIRDETKVRCAFAEEPAFDTVGKYTVPLLLTDRGGNETRLNATLTVMPLKETLTWEAGTTPPELAQFLLPDGQVALLALATQEELDALGVTPPASMDLSELVEQTGDHTVYLMADGLLCAVVLHVEDTQPPELITQDRTLAVGTQLQAEWFLSQARDASELSFSLTHEAPLTQAGVQSVVIRARDAFGNQSEGRATLTLLEDDAPPVIHGAQDLTAFAGKTTSFLAGVWASDDLDPEPVLSVNSDEVNFKEAGTYPILYTAVDSAGNRAEVKCSLTVVVEEIDEERVLAQAKQILGTIVAPDATPYETIETIYAWIRSNIAYRNNDVPDDPYRAAYQGMVFHWGECYVFQSTARAMLTAAGIENRLIDTVPYYDIHYWNLVNIGDGWYHFDTTPFRDRQVFFYLDTETLMSRSGNYPSSHTFDPERFSFVK